MNNKARGLLIAGIVLLGMFLLISGDVIRSNIVKAYRFPSKSMEPTLLMGDRVLVDRREAARNPKRGDLIVFEYPEDPSRDFLKRVVAVGGDTLEIKDKVLYLNGKVENEPYAVYQDKDVRPAGVDQRDNFGPQVIPKDSYFVMGDNRDKSYDSRYFGVVPKNKIKGTVRGIYWSWDRERHSIRWDRIGVDVK